MKDKKEENATKTFACQTTCMGFQTQGSDGRTYLTWRVELLENGQPTDIWAECWETGTGWRVDYLQMGALGLVDALCVCYRSLLDYMNMNSKVQLVPGIPPCHAGNGRQPADKPKEH